MGTRVHDFKGYTVALGGLEITGFDEDAGVVVDYLSQNYDSNVGSDGDVTVWKLHDPRRTITFTLKGDSPSNEYLSGLATLADIATDGTAFFSALVKDQNGTTKINSRLAVVMSRPSVEIKESASPRVWVVLCTEGADLIGGKSAI